MDLGTDEAGGAGSEPGVVGVASGTGARRRLGWPGGRVAGQPGGAGWSGGWSAGGPGAEFVGVADGPDVGDLVVGEVEGEDGGDGPLVLADQAGLAVDGALEEGQVGDAPGQVGQVGGDRAGALDGGERGGDHTAAVGDDRGVGVEQANDRVDVLGFPGSLEVAEQAGPLGPGCRRQL